MINIESYANTCTGSSEINGDIYYISEDKKVFILIDGALLVPEKMVKY